MNPWTMVSGLQAPGVFTPPLLPGLAQWLAADAKTYQDAGLTKPAVANGDPVKGWGDLSGSANNELTPAGQGAAALLLGAQNGLPAVSFDGVSSGLLALFPLAQPVTVFGVARMRAWRNNDTFFDGSTLNSMRMYEASGSPAVNFYAGASLPVVNNLPVDIFFSLEAVFNGASSKVVVSNGSPLLGNTGAASPNGVTLGTAGNGVHYGQVDFGEWALWPRLLNASEELAMWNYLRARWATW